MIDGKLKRQAKAKENKNALTVCKSCAKEGYQKQYKITATVHGKVYIKMDVTQVWQQQTSALQHTHNIKTSKKKEGELSCPECGKGENQ